MTEFTVRAATAEDAEDIAYVHVASWQSTYRGVVADEFLDAISREARAEQWRMALTNPRIPTFVYVAQQPDGAVVGFASGGPTQTKVKGFDGELYAIYVLENYQRLGLGTRLFHAVTEHLKTDGMNNMILWVLEQNPASRRFYEHMGGQEAGSKPYQIGEQELPAVAYGYPDLESLGLLDEAS